MRSPPPQLNSFPKGLEKLRRLDHRQPRLCPKGARLPEVRRVHPAIRAHDHRHLEEHPIDFIGAMAKARVAQAIIVAPKSSTSSPKDLCTCVTYMTCPCCAAVSETDLE